MSSQEQDRLDVQAARIRDTAAPQDPGFAEVVVNARVTTIAVYRKGAQPSEDVERTYRRCIDDDTQLQFRPALISRAEADTLTDQVTRAVPQLRARGVRLSHWAVEAAGGRFEIVVRAEGAALTVDTLRSLTTVPPTSLLLDPALVALRVVAATD